MTEAPSTTCLDEQQLHAYAEGLLQDEALAQTERHLAGCSFCRERAGAIRLNDTLPAAGGRGDIQDLIDDRYVVAGHLGSGAMGAVYEAWDRQLDRKVALKFLKHAHGHGEQDARQRMLREAQALARVSHPNVVVVHEFGTHDDGVYLAMELVQGQTLRSWQQSRPWREVLATYVQAGAGLAAAHRAEVVHRDFKPENVVVSDDGRARVLDFGIARLKQGALVPSAPHTGEPTLLTGEGALMGTPAYMSPEQLQGQPSDARSDQFSFCVALFEALTGARPFGGDTFEALRANVLQGRVVLPTRPRLPRRLVRALRRGLQVDPARRWPALDDLLAELAAVSRPLTRRFVAVTVASSALATLVVLAVLYRSTLCTAAPGQASAAWNDGVKADVRRAFLASGSPVAEITFERVVSLADAWREAWVQTATESCEATRLHGNQPDTLFTTRSRCLALQLERFSATTQALKRADLRTVVDGVKSVTRLPAPAEECSAAAASRDTSSSPDVKTQRAVDRLRPELATAEALVSTGRSAEARARLERLAPELREAGWQPLLAQAALTLARAHLGESHITAAESAALDAVDAAERAGDVALQASARLLLSEVVAVRQWREDDGRRLFRAAAVAIERAGQAPALEAVLFEQRAEFEANLGRMTDAHAAATRALRLRELAGERDAPALASALTSLARVALFDTTLVPDWEAHLARALSLQRNALGARHPDVGRTLRVRGMLRHRYQRGDALADVLEAADIVAGTLGDSAELAEVLVTHGQLLYDAQQFEEAKGVMERTLAMQRRFLEPEHPLILQTLNNLAGVAEYQGEGSFEEQYARRTTLLALAESRFGKESAKWALFFLNWCGSAARAAQAGDIASRCTAEGPRVERLLPKMLHGTWKRHLARLQLDAGQISAARDLLGEAHALETGHGLAVVEAYQHMADLRGGREGPVARAWLVRRAASAADGAAPERLLAREILGFLAQKK